MLHQATARNAPGEEPHQAEGSASAISNAIVRIVAGFTGRGPSTVRTIIDGDAVSVLLYDSLTKAERALLDHGQVDLARRFRSGLHGVMRDELVAAVERLLGREVTAFMADSRPDAEVAVQIFMLKPQPHS
jgi:uncharacterized protein YbcI